MTRTRRRIATVASMVVLALGASACGGDDDSAAEPTPSPTGSTTATESSTSPTSPTGESSAPTSGVAPAAGPELHLGVMSVHAPEGFAADDTRITGQEISASASNGLLQLIEIEGAADVPLDVAAKNFVKSIQGAKDVQRLPNVFLGEDQVEALRFAWIDTGTGDHYDAALAYRNGVSASLRLSVSSGRYTKEPDLFDTVLASVQWLA